MISCVIKDFYILLDEYPDRLENYSKYKKFITQIMKNNKDNELPTIEIMTVIQSKRPFIYAQLKQQRNNILLQFLTSLEMDKIEAEKRLEKLKEI